MESLNALKRREEGAERRKATLDTVRLPAAADHDDLVSVHSRRGAAGDYRRAAGAETRRAAGTAVFTGMLGVTLFGIFLTPMFFMIQWFDRQLAILKRRGVPPTYGWIVDRRGWRIDRSAGMNHSVSPVV